jgi:hypothetical protein
VKRWGRFWSWIRIIVGRRETTDTDAFAITSSRLPHRFRTGKLEAKSCVARFFGKKVQAGTVLADKKSGFKPRL